MGKYIKKTDRLDSAGGGIARISLSAHATCAEDKYCFGINFKPDTKRKWIETHDLFTASDGRIYTLVDTQLRVYFMDALTGTLFAFGECMSSQNIDPKSFKRDPKAAETLMKMKPQI